MGRIKDMLKQWLGIMPATNNSIVIQEPLSFEMNAIKNRIWYRGDPSELEQLFMQIANDPVTQARFWALRPSRSNNVRKLHSGLPSMIVNVLSNTVVGSLKEAEFGDLRAAGGRIRTWENIAKENKFNDFLTQAVQDCLIVGDGAFKISFDTDLSQYPIIEFYSGEKVEYKLNRGRVEEVIFLTSYDVDKRKYTLNETYGKGYVTYQLMNESGDEVGLGTVPELEKLVPVRYKGDFILAVPMKIDPSPKWDGRGQSIFDRKTDTFDALDETISVWQDAVRAGRVKRYIPESMIPHDPATGKAMPINLLDNQYTAIGSNMAEDAENRINTDQPRIDYDGLLASYITNLDLCLQGIVSPSTLGIDTKKLDNAEAQREKEKTTLYTRGKIIDVLQKVLPELVDISLKADDVLNRRTPEDTECTFNFQEYANPSFEAQVETVSKGASSQIMSIESQVDTLWGETKDKRWREEEVIRIKAEKGIVQMDEPDYKPNGFAAEEEMLNVDRHLNYDSDRDGTEPVREHGEKPQEARSRGSERGGKVDTVASSPDEERKSVKS